MEAPKRRQRRPNFDRIHKIEQFGMKPYSKRHNGNITAILTIHDLFEDLQYVDSRVIDKSISGRVTEITSKDGSIYFTVADQSSTLHCRILLSKFGVASFEQLRQVLSTYDYVYVNLDQMYRNEGGYLVGRVKSIHIEAPCISSLLTDHIEGHEVSKKKKWFKLATSLEARERLKQRGVIERHLRRVLSDENDFLEVTTGRFSVTPDVTGNTALTLKQTQGDQELYLRHSPEWALKQLVVGGIERVFELTTVYRSVAVDSLNYPESLQLLGYMSPGDMDTMIDLVEALISSLARKLQSTQLVPWKRLKLKNGGPTPEEYRLDDVMSDGMDDDPTIYINLRGEWARRTVNDLVFDVTRVDFSRLQSVSKARMLAEQVGVEFSDAVPASTVGEIATAILHQVVAPNLIQPTFVIEFPTEAYGMAKKNSRRPEVSECFELYINGIMMCSGCSEVNDPRALSSKRAYAEAAEELLSFGMPPTGGLALDVDRLVMLMTGATDIREVILFPTWGERES